MDLLGSILNSMDKPPAVNEKDKEIQRKQKEFAEKTRSKEKEEMNRFRKYAEERIGRFAKDERKCIEFQPLDKVYRAIIYFHYKKSTSVLTSTLHGVVQKLSLKCPKRRRFGLHHIKIPITSLSLAAIDERRNTSYGSRHDISEVAGLVAMSFGQEGVDRHTIVYKKDHGPTEDEVTARRLGDDWNDEKAKEYAQKREDAKLVKIENERSSEKVIPASNYKDKYVHLIGQEAALEAARKTQSNKNYGFVPSENKKDLRSIEQTMADIQAKKRLKTQHLLQSTDATLKDNV